jgi:hypothetical protein
MIILRKESYEHKNEAGKSLFLIEVYVHKDVYVFMEETGTMAQLPIELMDESALKDTEHVILFVDVMLYFPFSVEKINKAVAEKIEYIEIKLKENQQADVTEDLKELARLIEQTPKIALIYLPKIALDDEGNYSEHNIRPLIDDDLIEYYNSARYQSSLIKIYTIRLFEKELGEDNVFKRKFLNIVTKETDEWLFNCLHFAIYHKVDDFRIEKITLQEAIKATNEIFNKELLEAFAHNCSYMILETADLEDKLLIVSDKANEPMLFFVLP